MYMMYLINRSNKIHNFMIFGTYSRKRLKPGEKFYFEGTKQEMDFYRRLASSKIFISKEPGDVKKVAEGGSEVIVDHENNAKINEFLSKVELVGEKVSEQETVKEEYKGENGGDVVEESVVEEEIKPLKDDEELSPDAVYTMDFLTKKKAIVILEQRNIPFDENSAATDLKNMVINSNPEV